MLTLRGAMPREAAARHPVRARAHGGVALRAVSCIRPEPGIEAMITTHGRSQPGRVHTRMRPNGQFRVVQPLLHRAFAAPAGPCEGV